MKQKRAQGLSLNVIIIAAIVIIVLLVLIFIFSGGMGKFTGGLKSAEESCVSKGGYCTEPENCKTTVIMGTTGCGGSKSTCCKFG